MDSLKALLAVVIVCIDHNKRCIKNFLCSKHSLTGSPWLCTAFRQSSRNVVDILESIVYRYIVRGTNGCNTITDDLLELLLDILTDDKDYMIEACLNCVMDRVIYDDVIRSIHRLQLLDSCSEAATDTSSHDK